MSNESLDSRLTEFLNTHGNWCDSDIPVKDLTKTWSVVAQIPRYQKDKFDYYLCQNEDTNIAIYRTPKTKQQITTEVTP